MSKDAREGMGEEDRPTSDAFGPWLRRQREIRQIQLQEIADRTKISIRYLKAMEQDRFELLPGAVFTRGFLREYARYVGLNPDEVVNFYLSTREEEQDDSMEAEPEPPKRSRPPVVPILAALLVLAALAVAGWLLFRYLTGSPETSDPQPPRAERTIPAQPDPGPDESVPAAADAAGSRGSGEESTAAPAAVEEEPLQITLDFREDCWIEARIDEKDMLSQRFAQGESLQISASSRIEFLTLGNAGGLSVHVNGIPYSLDADSGDVLRNVTIDLETVRRLEERGR